MPPGGWPGRGAPLMRVRIVAGAIGWMAAAGAVMPTHAQTVRVTGTSTLQYVRVRPLVTDSVPVGLTLGDGLIRRTADGHLVRCVTGEQFCRFTRSDEAQNVLPLIQDITASVWGIGRGVRVQTQIRTRAMVGGRDELWPRGDDAFDALVAFVEVDRPRFRARGGRQWKTSGLGYYNYDGASVLVRVRPGLQLEAWGGWSLARGLNEPRTSESVSAIEPLAPDRRALLFGGQVSYRPNARLGVSALYQREIRTDRVGFYAERIAADGVWRWRDGSVEGTLEADVSTRTLNDARLSTRVAATDAITVSAFTRRYRPFFELWTIWGVFDPVGFTEAGVGGDYRTAERGVGIGIDLARRVYAETNASTVFGSYRSSGWTASAVGSYRPAPEWQVQGTYRVDFGFGAARSDASIRVQRELAEGTWVAASGVAFEQQFEFRVAEGTVYGLSLDGALRLGPRNRLTGSLSWYEHTGASTQPDVDWSQVRGLLRFEWTVGPEPGMSAGAR